MSMHITHITTHASADEAAWLIDFLDILREALCETYGEQIAQMHRDHCTHCKRAGNHVGCPTRARGLAFGLGIKPRA